MTPSLSLAAVMSHVMMARGVVTTAAVQADRAEHLAQVREQAICGVGRGARGGGACQAGDRSASPGVISLLCGMGSRQLHRYR